MNLDTGNIQAISSLGATGILAVIVILFVRGDILSRPVYEKMTEQIIQRVITEVSTRLITAVTEMIRDWESSRFQFENEKLRQWGKQLIAEMEDDNPFMQRSGETERGETDRGRRA